MTQELEDDRNSNPLLGRSVGPYQGSDQDMAKATTKDAGAGNKENTYPNTLYTRFNHTWLKKPTPLKSLTKRI